MALGNKFPLWYPTAGLHIGDSVQHLLYKDLPAFSANQSTVSQALGACKFRRFAYG